MALSVLDGRFLRAAAGLVASVLMAGAAIAGVSAAGVLAASVLTAGVLTACDGADGTSDTLAGGLWDQAWVA